MHRIDTSTAQINKFGPGKNGFTNGDKSTGRRATQLTDTYYDSIQEEICSVIESTGIPLNKNDNSQLLESIGRLIVNNSYPVGVVIWFAENKNPHDLFPGTSWASISEDRAVRLAKPDGSDVLTTGGSDSIRLSTSHLPAHTHSFSAMTSSFNHGTKKTSSTGTHTHPVSGTAASAGAHTHQGGIGAPGGRWRNYVSGSDNSFDYGSNLTNSAGAHTHPVSGTAAAAGAHEHTVNIGSHAHSLSGVTGGAGSGLAVNITNKYIKLMAWYRIA